tara:strand:+ start:1153 stop:2151 length:999 start_codon:yes stop_codon:yes gene_type:complete
MGKNRILVVYNTCGLSIEPDERHWIKEIEMLLAQSMPGVHIVHSDCGTSAEKRSVVKDYFGTKISYYHTPEGLPVQQTCNHAIKNVIKQKGRFEFYCYLGAGINMWHEHHLAYAYKLMKEEGDIGKCDFHVIRHPSIEQRMEEMHPPRDFYMFIQSNPKEKCFTLKPGQRVNNHCAMFSDKFCKAFNDRILPDCFAGNGAEGVYTFLTSCVDTRHIVMSYKYCPSVHHFPDLDGANQFLLEKGEERTYFYDWVYNNSVNLDELNRKGSKWGFTTDTPENEYCSLQVPREEFNKHGLPKTKQQQEKLYELISKNIFISNKYLDYDKIQHEFIS